jgi:hypothetical protein
MLHLHKTALPANLRLEWKWLTVANTFAYETEIITAVKSFIVQAPGLNLNYVELQNALAYVVDKWSHLLNDGT